VASNLTPEEQQELLALETELEPATPEPALTAEEQAELEALEAEVPELEQAERKGQLGAGLKGLAAGASLGFSDEIIEMCRSRWKGLGRPFRSSF